MLKKILTILISILLLSNTAYADQGAIAKYAGTGESAYRDGDRLKAGFNIPYGIAVDKDGSLIVVDSYNNLIRRITGDKVTTLAGISEKKDLYGFPIGGYNDSDALKSRFNRPRGAAVDSKGNIYITDTGNNVVRKITGGKVYTFAGSGKEGYKDGKAAEAQFRSPSGIVADSSGNIYVADSLNNVIRKINSKGEVSTYAGVYSTNGGYLDGSLFQAKFNEPSDLAFDKWGTLYVLDSGNQLVRKIENGIVSTYSGKKWLSYENGYAKSGFEDGKADSARFNFPKGIIACDNGILLIADTWNNRIRALKTDGTAVTIAGDGAASDTVFDGPVSLAYSQNKLFISDMWSNSIKSMELKLDSIADIKPQLNWNEVSFEPKSAAPQVWFKYKRLNFTDSQPYISKSRAMLPLKETCELLGYKFTEGSKGNEAVVNKEGRNIVIPLAEDWIEIRDGKVFIHVKYMAEKLNLKTEWIRDYNAVMLSD